LYTFSGRPYAFFTVDAADKITGLLVQLAMLYHVNAKVMYALPLRLADRLRPAASGFIEIHLISARSSKAIKPTE
jgi:hypothetical protein